MGMANEIWEEFINAYPQAQSGKLSLEEINALMAKHMRQRNAAPLDDFDGLSPEQMHILLHNPFNSSSPLEWIAQRHEDQAASVPLLILSDLLISEINRTGELKLTSKGNLPVSTCTLLVERDVIQSKYMKYVKKLTEDNIPYTWPIKDHLLAEGLVKKRSNKLSLTKNGERYTNLPNSARLLHLFTFFTNRFHWQNLHGYSDDGKSGHLGWAYSLFLFLKHGDQVRNATFYSDKWMLAFEKELWQVRTDTRYHREIEYVKHAYAWRFFENFLRWFGLAHVEEKRIPGEFREVIEVKKTDLADNLIRLT